MVTKYVLIILMASNATTYSHGQPAVSQQTYGDIIACTSAGNAVQDAIKGMDVQFGENRPAVSVVCTPEETPDKP